MFRTEQMFYIWNLFLNAPVLENVFFDYSWISRKKSLETHTFFTVDGEQLRLDYEFDLTEFTTEHVYNWTPADLNKMVTTLLIKISGDLEDWQKA